MTWSHSAPGRALRPLPESFVRQQSVTCAVSRGIVVQAKRIGAD